MIGLRLLLHVHADKRREFIQSVADLLPQQQMQTCKSLLLRSITDDTLFCLIVDCEEKLQLDRFMNSNRYHALLGAATVLGHSENLNLLEYRPVLQKS